MTGQPKCSSTRRISRFLPSRKAIVSQALLPCTRSSRAWIGPYWKPSITMPFCSPSSLLSSIRPCTPHAVTPQPARRRQLEAALELAVVGQQQQTLRAHVQAADRHQPRQAFGQAVVDRRPAFGIARGSQHAGRLVIAEQAWLLGLRQGSPSIVIHFASVTVTAGLSSTSPSTATRPVAIRRSASRREQYPERAIRFATRSSLEPLTSHGSPRPRRRTGHRRRPRSGIPDAIARRRKSAARDLDRFDHAIRRAPADHHAGADRACGLVMRAIDLEASAATDLMQHRPGPRRPRARFGTRVRLLVGQAAWDRVRNVLDQIAPKITLSSCWPPQMPNGQVTVERCPGYRPLEGGALLLGADGGVRSRARTATGRGRTRRRSPPVRPAGRGRPPPDPSGVATQRQPASADDRRTIVLANGIPGQAAVPTRRFRIQGQADAGLALLARCIALGSLQLRSVR